MSTSETLPLSSYDRINGFISSLDRRELKPCISLVRYGVIPTRHDVAIWNSIPDTLLHKLFNFHEGCDPSQTEIGMVFFQISTNPLISSSIISMCLAVEPSETEIQQAFIDSASKEVQVMEGTPRSPSINWKLFFKPSRSENIVTNCQSTDATPFVYRVNASLRRFRDTIEYSRIWPHGTSRGISRQGRESLAKLRSLATSTPWLREEDKHRPATSRDVVNHYIHTGLWADGACEMKQKWYPAQLVPRTYFAQGGTAIRVSCYLRNFFNDFTDSYVPTDRFARVDGSRLICPDGGHFLIYDLTSFTSNFFEQRSFLKHMADFFRYTLVFLVGPNLSLLEASLGDLIDTYCDEINTLPQYEFNKDILDFATDTLLFTHHIAGFLGVPGNLSTCTLAHGLAVGVCLRDDQRQSCAGDDGNVGVEDDSNEQEVKRMIHYLGVFNDEKASSTKETKRGSYLKRPFMQVGNQGQMIERVDYPLLGAVNLMTKDDPRFLKLSQDRAKLRKSIAASTARLVRALYEHSNGYFRPGVLEYILLFIKDIYAKAALPTSGMVRGFYGSNLDYESFRIEAAVVFPISERFFRRDPDVVLSEDFLPWIVEVPVWTDEEIRFSHGEDWQIGYSRTGRSAPVLEKLCAMGFLDRVETERTTLVGEAARRHFRRFGKDDFRRQEYTYTARLNLSSDQLLSIGLSGLDDSEWKRQFTQASYSRPLSLRSQSRDFDKEVADLDTGALNLEDLY